jgi:hypothetical protein
MIRPITRSDVPSVVELASHMHQEGVYSPYNFNGNKLHRHIEGYVDKEHSCGFVYIRDDTIQGAVFGHLDNHYFGDSSLAIQNGFFIKKEARGGMAAIKLLRSFEDWAVTKDVDCICFSTSNNGKDDRWLKFCEARGYEHVGYVFHKKV